MCMMCKSSSATQLLAGTWLGLIEYSCHFCPNIGMIYYLLVPTSSSAELLDLLLQELCKSIIGETGQQLSRASPAHAHRFVQAILALASHPDTHLQAFLWLTLSSQLRTLEPALLRSIAKSAEALIIEVHKVRVTFPQENLSCQS